ncbi:RNA polymerase, sigma-24 subunit, ECF subfamily [Candidatus Vecturithrix granuli]|uniref:RNA polymerase, sigma-24 subunit, ECF subfamily n=1 Tax=Vecturithrix granuli TaxID=1499967 RepID=A0A081C5U8_VECG1|nr:RNA polymerase, sigma-24 subunit, ECF subfamily [Candidatus Vecturithrix granuli]
MMTSGSAAAATALQLYPLPKFPAFSGWQALRPEHTPVIARENQPSREVPLPAPLPLEERSDFDLIDLTVSGQQEAFDVLVKRYSGSVYALAYRMLRNQEDAADIAQDVFLKAYEALSSFRKKSSFHTWLYRIASNSCINYLRRYSAQRHIELTNYHAAKEADSLDTLYTMELQEIVNEAIEKLPEKQKATVLLRVCEGLSHREVSRILKCSVGTAKANYFHAIRNLRRFMKNYITANEGEEAIPANMFGAESFVH